MKVRIEPSTESLVDELMPLLWEGAEITARDIITAIRTCGYEISREVELTGPLREAVIGLDRGDVGGYIRAGRPTRREENENT